MTSPGEQYLAFDLGAESGRAILGTLCDDRVALEEMHRFANGPVQVRDSLYWDPLRLWQEMKQGLARVAGQHGRDLRGIAVDTWGVDFALVDARGELLGLPYHYRDKRTDGMLAEVLQQVPALELYQQVGSAHFSISTLCQLLAMRRQGSPALDTAHRLLMMADLFNFWLSGRQATEATAAGTTQFYDPSAAPGGCDLLARLGLPPALPGELAPSASILGPLLPSVAAEVGLPAVPVLVPACHDTPCAFAAAPAETPDYTAISCGTWSVVGSELDEPLLTEEAMNAGYLNEAAAGGKVLLALNSIGLWPLQECRREWRSQGHDWSYADLTEMAAAAPPFTAIVNPDAGDFMRVGDMTAKIAAYCRRTGQPPPPDPASTVRSLLEGLALRYRRSIADLDRLTGRQTRVVHLFGGGARNRLLCQFTADATGCPVVAGPDEATATANVLLQALATGSLGSIAEVRQVVRRSYDLVAYEPRPSSPWDDAYDRFHALCASTADR